MGILDRILRAGEGKKVKALEGIVPDVNALGPEIRGTERRRAEGQDATSSASGSTTVRTSTIC